MKFIPYEQLDFKTGPFIYMYISLRVKQRIQCIVVAIGHAVKITSACWEYAERGSHPDGVKYRRKASKDVLETPLQFYMKILLILIKIFIE